MSSKETNLEVATDSVNTNKEPKRKYKKRNREEEYIQFEEHCRKMRLLQRSLPEKIKRLRRGEIKVEDLSEVSDEDLEPSVTNQLCNLEQKVKDLEAKYASLQKAME